MLSVVILTKNEEKNIADCLTSVSWCEEKIIIDDNSIDNTVDIAKKHGAIVYSHSLNNDFAQQRNFGLEKVHGEWVLFIDADERVSAPLWYEIMQLTNAADQLFTGFYIKRLDTMWGKQLHYGENSSLRLLRLAKKNSGKWHGNVHETWDIKGKTLVLQNHLDHYPHQSVDNFLNEINFYTDLRARELMKKKAQFFSWHIIVYPAGKFIYNYIFRLGFLDGLQGLVFAIMMSFHSFLVRGKVWFLKQRK